MKRISVREREREGGGRERRRKKDRKKSFFCEEIKQRKDKKNRIQ